MKLPFFKTNINSKLSVIEKTDVDIKIKNLFHSELPSPAGLTITFTFTTTYGRKGDKFASKLAESGDCINYYLNKDKKYEIAGSTQKLTNNEFEIRQVLLAKIAMGVKYNCVLTAWDIATADKMHR